MPLIIDEEAMKTQNAEQDVTFARLDERLNVVINDLNVMLYEDDVDQQKRRKPNRRRKQEQKRA